MLAFVPHSMLSTNLVDNHGQSLIHRNESFLNDHMTYVVALMLSIALTTCTCHAASAQWYNWQSAHTAFALRLCMVANWEIIFHSAFLRAEVYRLAKVCFIFKPMRPQAEVPDEKKNAISICPTLQ